MRNNSTESLSFFKRFSERNVDEYRKAELEGSPIKDKKFDWYGFTKQKISFFRKKKQRFRNASLKASMMKRYHYDICRL